uniref:uncharacterized protein n=1 Tax=Myxine glutinosa TaxID=7769 RepID=UPI00358F8E94
MGRFIPTFLMFSFLWIAFVAASTSPPTTQPATSSKNMVYTISFKIVNKAFHEDLYNSSSPAFLQLAQEIEDPMNTVLKITYPSTFIAYKVNSFVNGSVVVKSESTFKTRDPLTAEHLSLYIFNLRNGAEINFLNTNLKIASDSVQIQNGTALARTSQTLPNSPVITSTARTSGTATAQNSKASSSRAPSTAKTTALTRTSTASSTLSPTTQPSKKVNYSLRLKIVNHKFHEDLHNNASPAFRELANEIESELNMVFKKAYPSTFIACKVK